MKQRSQNSAGVPMCITGFTVSPVPWWTLAGVGWRRRLVEGKAWGRNAKFTAELIR